MTDTVTAPVELHRPGRAARQAAQIGGAIPTLDTRRMQLRAPRIYDFDAYAEILCSERGKHMGGPFSREEAWADFTQAIANWFLHGHGLWTIDTLGEPSAGFVLLGFEYADPEPELGIFVKKSIEGEGFAHEACEAALKHAFEDLGWDSVCSFVDPKNARCVRLMEELRAARDKTLEAELGGETLVFRHLKPEVA